MVINQTGQRENIASSVKKNIITTTIRKTKTKTMTNKINTAQIVTTQQGNVAKW